MSKISTAFSLLYRIPRRWYVRWRLNRRSAADVFTEIYETNAWGSTESVSGPGSDLKHTQELVEVIPELIRELNATSVLDIPCGDFNWMRTIDLGDVLYIGADIVEDLIERNTEAFSGPNRSFQQVDLLTDNIPDADLVICRDCLVHLSFRDAKRALQQLCESQCKFLLTTTFTARTKNTDIATGQWRPLNLQAAPFNLPAPRNIIREFPEDSESPYADKCLAVWSIGDLQNAESLR